MSDDDTQHRNTNDKFIAGRKEPQQGQADMKSLSASQNNPSALSSNQSPQDQPKQQQSLTASQQPQAAQNSKTDTLPSLKTNDQHPVAQKNQDKPKEKAPQPTGQASNANQNHNGKAVNDHANKHDEENDSFEDNDHNKSSNLADEIPSYYKNNASAFDDSTDQLHQNHSKAASHHKNNTNNSHLNNNSNILNGLDHTNTNDQQVSPLKSRSVVGTESKVKQQPVKLTAAQELKEQQMDKLVMQNLNLREQLREMATMLDDIIEKEKEQRALKYSGNRPIESEQIKQRRKELQKQTDLIASNRMLIQQKKRQLEYNFDINRITEKENEIKRLRRELEEIAEEKLGLQKITDEQKRAKADIDRKEYREQLEVINKQFLSAKDENMLLNEHLKEKDKELKKYIDELKMRTEKIRTVNLRAKEFQRKQIAAAAAVKQIQQQMPSQKQDSKSKNKPKIDQDEEISEENLQILEERVIVLEKERLDLQKNMIEKMKELEKERKQQKSEVDKKQLVLKERENTLKLTQMKLKEITKFIKATAAENEKKQQMEAMQAKQEQQANMQLPMLEDAKQSAMKGRNSSVTSKKSRNN